MAVREKRSVRPVAAPERMTISVGIHGDEGDDAHAAEYAADGALGSAQGLTVADVGRFQEFGLGVPQRSFIRGWFDESQDFIRETLRSQMKLVVAGKLTSEKAMNRIALAFEGSVKQRIARGVGPALARSTVLAKGSSKQLIDSGQLRSAVRGKGVIG